MSTAQLSLTEQRLARQSHQYATFRVGELFFGIEVLEVQEVLRYLEMTCVPLAPVVIEGLINLRGEIVTAIDMRRRLGLAPRPDGQVPMNMVIRSEDGAVSLLVDEIGDVLNLDDETLEPVPDNLPAEQKVSIAGVHKLADGLLLVLNATGTLCIEVN
jgi:purine-binding chemotaxis protein CheW